MKKLASIVLGVLMAATGLCGCGKSKKPEPAFCTQAADSLVSLGNTRRLKTVMEKAERGETVTMAYIGGSITEGCNAVRGLSWSDLSYKFFSERYAKGDNVKYVNAGMSGTCSVVGSVRYETDVLEQTAAVEGESGDGLPEILFIEFAVNDGDSAEYTDGAAYEGLIRQALAQPNNPAVILVFSVFKSGMWNKQETYIPYGEYYSLPMVSIKNAIEDETAEFKYDFFASDGWHPTDEGHSIMADCVNYMFYQAEKQKMPASDSGVPSVPYKSADYTGVTLIDSNHIPAGVTLNKGSFNSTDNATCTYSRSSTKLNEKMFLGNFYHMDKGDNATLGDFQMSLSCKKLILIFKKASSATFGAIDIYVNGVYSKTVDSYDRSGWNNAWSVGIVDGTETQNYEITIKMKEGDESKKFTILALGYA